MNLPNDPRMHEKLCALILGEASEAERAEVERALEQSQELRAERARLERTIEAVRQAGLGELALDEDARAELARAAQAGSAAQADRSIEVAGHEAELPEAGAERAMRSSAAPETGISARPSLAASPATSGASGASPFGAPRAARTLTAGLPWARLAAGFAAVGLGALVWRAYERGGLGAVFHGSGPAPGGGSWTEASRPETGTSGAAHLITPSQTGAIGPEGHAVPRPPTPSELAKYGYGFSGGAPTPAAEPEGWETVTMYRVAPTADSANRQSAAASGAPAAAASAAGTYRGPSDTTPATPRQQPGNEVAGSDDFYLGRGEREFQPVGDAKHDPSTGTTHQWRDTRVAPSNPKGEPKLAFEMNRTDGVTSAGPSGAPAPSAGVSVGAGGKFGGRFGGKTSAGAGGKPLVQSDAIAKLKAMGYSGGATGSVRREALDAPPPEEFLEEQPSGEPVLQDIETLTEGDEQRLGMPDANYWLSECVRRPNERPSAMFFRFWGDNAFELASRDPLSTFSIDVDTASYALARRTLEAGRLPVKEQVRTEEFLNYFAPDLQAPTQGRLALSLEIAPSRFGGSNGGRDGEQHWLLRAGIRAQEIGQHERARLALTFVIDTSGSMEQQNRLELVKHALRLLVGQLDAGDQIALVGFSNDARVVLPLTNATRRAEIEQAIHGLSANGGTNAEAGLKLGYELAAQTLRAGATNRVVFLSDGVANIGQTTHEALSAAVQAQRARGIYLNTIGVGMGDHNDALLEQLADQGDGVCNYMDDAQEARRALVDNFVGAFQPVASDVKVQVEFDPAQVASYRLLGYENRAVADADFRRDSVDAGEIGSGQQVVALYELVRRMPAEVERPLAVLRVRSKGPKGSPDAQVASEQTLGISNRDVRASYGAASAGYRRSALVAQFAEMLRQSVHARGDSLGALLDEARALERELRGSPAGAEFAEFVSLVERAAALALVVAEPQAELERLLDALRHNAYALARIDGLDLPELQAERERLLQRQRELEQSLRELLDPQRIDVAPR